MISIEKLQAENKKLKQQIQELQDFKNNAEESCEGFAITEMLSKRIEEAEKSREEAEKSRDIYKNTISKMNNIIWENLGIENDWNFRASYQLFYSNMFSPTDSNWDKIEQVSFDILTEILKEANTHSKEREKYKKSLDLIYEEIEHIVEFCDIDALVENMEINDWDTYERDKCKFVITYFNHHIQDDFKYNDIFIFEECYDEGDEVDYYIEDAYRCVEEIADYWDKYSSIIYTNWLISEWINDMNDM